MSAIRPDLPAFGQPAAPSSGSAAREAQAAFFRAALGQTGGGATAPAAQPPASQASTARSDPSRTLTPQITPTTRATAAPDPDRPLRPGSLLDIRI